ncbi:MAG: hypothetical protein A2V90_04840 [Gammaproteobacteria bacterium RBG_16_57_12]|nr:MAG: hypothetical protein A2V90_04840 [Gammaproteobacteria bacterium RBG_16_57_12]
MQIHAVSVKAEDYNRVRLALLRIASPLRLALPHLRNLCMMMDEELWLVVDESMDDLPIMAWTDFQVTGRRTLHEQIKCKLRYYHIHAGLILNQVFADVEAALAEQLASHQTDSGDKVRSLPPKS